MKTTSIPVQVRLKPETINRIENLRALTGRNKTQVIVDALAVLDKIVEVQQSGGSLLIEKPDGRTVQLEFVGL
jgi:multidrug efflux pump subunit AcrB